jgi:S-formylglutathione hydrolase
MIATISKHACFGGTLGYFQHPSKVNDCDMKFAVFTPPQAAKGPVPVVYYLAGLTCTEETFMTKGCALEHAARHGLMLVAPDTSPRVPLPGDRDSWDFGVAAGFYLDAAESPWSKHYKMYSYVVNELPVAVGPKKSPARTTMQRTPCCSAASRSRRSISARMAPLRVTGCCGASSCSTSPASGP